jgi:Domain of unknown function (DUF4139)/N-terminal domain of unknown function (DUF4140)
MKTCTFSKFLLVAISLASPLFSLAQDTTAKAAALPVNSKIEQVTVFLQGAQVQRKGSTMLTKGRNELIFKSLSPFLDKESIRLKGDGNFTVLSVNYAINHIDEQQKRSDVEKMETQREKIKQQIDLENIGVGAWQYEIASLQKNDVVSSTQNGVKTNDLKELMDYRTARLQETNLKIYNSNKKIADWYTEINKVNAQLSEINAKSATFTGEITIVVNAESAGNAKFDLSYSVGNASWQMTYDLRVKDVASPMNLLYKANVQQQSGEDWKDVKLVFSTGNPTFNNTQPTVQPWYLRMGSVGYDDNTVSGGISDANEGRGITVRGSRSDGNVVMVDGKIETIPPVYETVTEQILVKPARKKIVEVATEYSNATEQVMVSPATKKWENGREIDIPAEYKTITKRQPQAPATFREIEIPAEYKTITKQVLKQDAQTRYVNMPTEYKAKKAKAGATFEDKSPLNITSSDNITNTLYEVGLPYTVLNDGKTYTAEIRNGVIPASYEYFVAPKQSTDAYLTALVTNWDELQLVSGEAALYYEGTYMGKTRLNPDNTNDTLRISLGIDKGIVVQRTKLKEFAKKQFWGDKQSDERAYEIAIRNRKAQVINIIIADQFPLSAQKEITVERMEYKDTKTERTDYKAANLDENTGKITWKQTIEAAKERKFVLHYKVKYPKGWRVEVD